MLSVPCYRSLARGRVGERKEEEEEGEEKERRKRERCVDERHR